MCIGCSTLHFAKMSPVSAWGMPRRISPSYATLLVPFRQARFCDVQSCLCGCFTRHNGEDETYCVTSSTLPSQAIVVTRWSEALGTMMPSAQGERQDCEAMTCPPVPGRQELGWNGMVNRSERLINVVIANKPKALRGLDQNGTQHGRGAKRTPVVTMTLPANRADLPHSGTQTEHGKPVGFPLGKQLVRGADSPAGSGGGSKQRSPGNRVDRDCAQAISYRAKASRLPFGLSARKSLANRPRR